MTVLDSPAHGFRHLPHLARERRVLARCGVLVVALLMAVVVTACDDSSEANPQPGSSANAAASTGDVRGLAVDSERGEPIKLTLTGLFRGTGSGQDWESIAASANLDWESAAGVIVNPDNPDNLYLWGPGMGVLRSDSGGADWQAVMTGLPNDDIGALAMHTNRRDTLYAWIKGQGVFRTEDGGQQWELMDAGPEVSSIQALAHSPLEGSMNTGWLYAASPEGVYLSMDCF